MSDELTVEEIKRLRTSICRNYSEYIRADMNCPVDLAFAQNAPSIVDTLLAKLSAQDEEVEKLRAALLSLMKAYGATDGRNGNSGECWDLARAALSEAKPEPVERRQGERINEEDFGDSY